MINYGKIKMSNKYNLLNLFKENSAANKHKKMTKNKNWHII